MKPKILLLGLMVLYFMVFNPITVKALDGSISGRVTRDSDGTGIQGIYVHFYDTSGQWITATSTDSSGNYTKGLAAGNYLCVCAGGYSRLRR